MECCLLTNAILNTTVVIIPQSLPSFFYDFFFSQRLSSYCSDVSLELTIREKRDTQVNSSLAKKEEKKCGQVVEG